MAVRGKPEGSKSPSRQKKHTVIWSRSDWERIEAAAKKLAEREQDEFSPTNVIRRAVRRYTADLLGLS